MASRERGEVLIMLNPLRADHNSKGTHTHINSSLIISTTFASCFIGSQQVQAIENVLISNDNNRNEVYKMGARSDMV